MKHFLRKIRFLRKVNAIIHLSRDLYSINKRKCPICGFNGYFDLNGFSKEEECPSCLSIGRHRLLGLFLKSPFFQSVKQDTLKTLHFAPEECLSSFIKNLSNNYIQADLFNKNVDLKLDIENIDLKDNSFNLIVANHVLEHVDDYKSSNELSRVLKNKGLLLLTVPIIPNWSETYEIERELSLKDQKIYFGMETHLRYYGNDFSKRITKYNNLQLIKEFIADGNDSVKYGLNRGESLFVFRKES